ncbi:hypothetical protein Ancab_034545 [Ancistrocladus abbreviatus]
MSLLPPRESPKKAKSMEYGASNLHFFRMIDSRNRSVYCHHTNLISSKGIFLHSNPLDYTVPLLLLQLSIIFISSKVCEYCLKPLRQSAIVGQILGGILLGPSGLGKEQSVERALFPTRSTLILETFATFGLVLFSFEMGLKMDSSMMIKPERLPMVIGVCVFTLSLTVPMAVCFILKANISMDPRLAESLPLLASSQSITAFQVVACLLTELKILNTDIGRLAIASCMFCDMIGIVVVAVVFSAAKGSTQAFLGSILSALGLFILVVFILRPAILRFVRGITDVDSFTDLHMFVVLFSVLVSAFVSEVVGQHYALGPLILGLALPDGPPLGATIVQKFSIIIHGIMYPAFLTISGLKTNIFQIRIQHLWILGVITLSATIVKFAATMVPAIYGNVPIQDAFVLGLIMNARGIAELIIYNLWNYDGRLSDRELTATVIMVLAMSVIITPLINCLYKPPNHYVPLRRMTIQHNKRDSELRIMVCIHNQDNMPSMISVLEASAATEESPVSVIGVILVELVGRTTPMFVAYQPERNLEPSASRSNHIQNAFKHYENQNEGFATVNLFTNMSHYDMMHDEICQIALDKRANILIVPFHKKWAVDGTIAGGSEAIRAVNQRLLDKAPCSLGILIDRGATNGVLSILNSQVIYQVAVLFIGGADDAEALAYGARMAWHEKVAVLVVRFLLFGNDNTRERKHETDLIDEYRHANIGNQRFEYQEEVVRDGVGLAEAIKSMERSFDLILVGRNHQQSQLLFGLDEWSEFPELGVVGDTLASETGSMASILVIQQQRISANRMLIQNDPALYVHDVPDVGGRSSRHNLLSISIDRHGRS